MMLPNTVIVHLKFEVNDTKKLAEVLELRNLPTKNGWDVGNVSMLQTELVPDPRLGLPYIVEMPCLYIPGVLPQEIRDPRGAQSSLNQQRDL